MKTMAGLLARVKGLEGEGLSTRMWTGGYNVPPTTVMKSIREDMLFIDEIVGAGEVAKLVHNQIALVVQQVVAEGLTLGTKAGIQPEKLLEASEDLGMAMPGLDIAKLPEGELMQTRGW